MAGTIAGKVLDISNGMPIDGASVTVQPGDHTTKTGGDGAYSLPVPAGTYSMELTSAGYDPFFADGVFVLDDATTEINIALRFAES